MYFHNILLFRKKTYVPMLASEYSLSKLLFLLKINFCWKYQQTLISHNLEPSHWNLKKIQEFMLTIRETKYVKMNFWNHGYFKYTKSVWFLQKWLLNCIVLDSAYTKIVLENMVKQLFEHFNAIGCPKRSRGKVLK